LVLARDFVAVLGAFLAAGAADFLALSTVVFGSALVFLAGMTGRLLEPVAGICKINLQKIPPGFSFWA
jgi:type IV secretory pathway VirB2 component (pilin)